MSRKPSRLARERRRKIVDGLLEALTRPGDSPTREEIEHFTLVVAYFGVHTQIDKILQEYCNTPDLQNEMRIGIITYLLNGLIRNPEPSDPQACPQA